MLCSLRARAHMSPPQCVMAGLTTGLSPVEWGYPMSQDARLCQLGDTRRRASDSGGLPPNEDRGAAFRVVPVQSNNAAPGLIVILAPARSQPTSGEYVLQMAISNHAARVGRQVPPGKHSRSHFSREGDWRTYEATHRWASRTCAVPQLRGGRPPRPMSFRPLIGP